MMTLQEAIPTRKVGAGIMAGSLTTILVFILSRYAAVEIPPDVAVAISTVLTTFASWLVPENR